MHMNDFKCMLTIHIVRKSRALSTKSRHIMSVLNVSHVCNSCLAADIIADVIDSMFFFLSFLVSLLFFQSYRFTLSH